MISQTLYRQDIQLDQVNHQFRVHRLDLYLLWGHVSRDFPSVQVFQPLISQVLLFHLFLLNGAISRDFMSNKTTEKFLTIRTFIARTSRWTSKSISAARARETGRSNISFFSRWAIQTTCSNRALFCNRFYLESHNPNFTAKIY